LAGSSNTIIYLHGDHLGSVSVLTNSTGGGPINQEFDPWGSVIAGSHNITTKNFTGQHLDGTGLLFYNARYYDPTIGRFLSADTIVPGITASSGGTPATVGHTRDTIIRTLTVAFHEEEFITQVGEENRSTFWFQRSDDERKKDPRPWGPHQPQALNRYSYTLNNPLRYTDPTGHWTFSNQCC
jgi:RHS repeat-associated protein